MKTRHLLCLLVMALYCLASQATAYTYTFRLSPENIAYMRFTEDVVEYNEWSTLRLPGISNIPEGYHFVGWFNAAGDTISTKYDVFNTYTDIPLPPHDEVYTAKFVYDPDAPELPGQYQGKPKLTVTSEPNYTVWYFQVSQEYTGNKALASGETIVLEADSTYQILLYSHMEGAYKFIGWKDEQDNLLSTEKNLTFVMPNHDLKLRACYIYDPNTPLLPNANPYDREGKQLTIDIHSPNNLWSTIEDICNVRDIRTGEIESLIVCGQMGQYDYSTHIRYENLKNLDFSRTTGTPIVETQFNHFPALEDLKLPACVDSIGIGVLNFRDKESVTLRQVTLYSKTPPHIYVLEDDPWGNSTLDMPEGVVIRVPATSVNLYRNADGWKDYTILPITDDIVNVTVDFPEGTDMAQYRDMLLDIQNMKSGERNTYIINARTRYVFTEVIKNAPYRIILRNAQGQVFGRSGIIDVEDSDMQVELTDLLVPLNAEISVATLSGSESEDVTGSVGIQWLDEQGNVIGSSSKFEGLASGSTVRARIVLPESLQAMYMQPEVQQWNVEDGTAMHPIVLQPYKTLSLKGIVKDLTDKRPLAGATITATQKVGAIITSASTTSDKNGAYTLELKKAAKETVITYSGRGYTSVTDTIKSLNTIEGETLAAKEILLEELAGSTITLELKEYALVEAEATPVLNDVAVAPNNMALQVAVNGVPTKEFSYTFPKITLRQRLSDYTLVSVTITSTDNTFEPVTENVYIRNNKGVIPMAIKPHGSIKASFKKTLNSKVIALLYDENGQLVTSAPFDANASATLSNLKEGNYTVIGMGECQYLNAFQSLDMFGYVGLREEKDYAKRQLWVYDGQIQETDLSFIPVIAENKFIFTGEETNVTLNKKSQVVGNVLTANCKFDFKPEYARKVTGVKLIAELPASAQYINNTMLLGNSPQPYMVDGQRIIVPIEGNSAERLRFCFIPMEQGNCSPAFYVQFTMDGIEMTQPIGSPTCNVENLYLKVEETVVKPEFTAFGMGPVGSDVRVIVNGAELARTTVKGNGEWTAKVDLGDPFNLQRFVVQAELTTKEGLVLKSQEALTTYDKYYVAPIAVIMSYLQTYWGDFRHVTFDLINKTVFPRKTSFANTSDFKFEIMLSRPERELVDSISLIAYSDNKWVSIPVSYNDSLQQWIGIKAFDAFHLPTSVHVDVFNCEGRLMSSEPLDNTLDKLFDFKDDEASEELAGMKEQISTLMGDDYTVEELRNYFDRMAELLGFSIDRTGWTYELPSAEQLEADRQKIEELLKGITLFDPRLENFDPANVDPSMLPENIQMLTCEGITEEWLLEQGYEHTPIEGNSGLYKLDTDNERHIVIPDRNVHLIMTLDQETAKLLARLKAPHKAGWLDIDIDDKLMKLSGKFRTAIDAFSGSVSEVLSFLHSESDELMGQLIEASHKMESMKINNAHKLDISAQEDVITSLKDAMGTNRKIAKWINDNIALGKLAGKALSIFDIANSIYNYLRDTKKIAEAWASVPEDCPDDQLRAALLRGEAYAALTAAIGWYAYNITSSTGAIGSASLGITAAPATGGGTLLAVGAAIELAVANYYAGEAYSEGLDYIVEDIGFGVQKLACVVGKRCPKCHKYECNCKPEPPEVEFEQDPSGYVYEGVESNRLEGVTATCYYKETLEDMYGDPYDHIDIWDAAPYSQINPQLTDAQGMYGWDVPQGLWQVRLHKNGYEDTQSEWLPVPPPQLEVNLPMKQNTPPTVSAAHAYPTGIEVEFSKYMDADYLTPDNILVSQNGEEVKGEVTLLDAEPMGADTTTVLANRIRFVPSAPYQADQEIQLLVSRQVKSYAGIRMEQDFLQTFDIEPEMTALETEHEVTVHMGTAKQLTIRVLPAEAAAGKQMDISIVGDAARINTTSVALNAQGEATLLVEGMLPGTSIITYTVPGSKLTASSIISVSTFNPEPPATPEASIASGVEVELGTGIYLSCMTQGAVIYYTLDGSCPCDEKNRFRYDGNPIIVTDVTNIRAMAVSKDGVEGDIAEFKYCLPGQLDGIENHKIEKLKIEPVLAEDYIDITLAENQQSGDIFIVGADGQCQKKGNTTNGKLRMNVANIPTGIYIVLSTSKNGTATGRFIKK